MIFTKPTILTLTFFLAKGTEAVLLRGKTDEGGDLRHLTTLDQDQPGYIHHTTGGCIGRNELGVTRNFDEQQCGGIVDNDGDGTASRTCGVADCAALCNDENNCVSFEYSKESNLGNGKTCTLSSTCNTYEKTVQTLNSSNYWYLKIHPLIQIDGYTVHSTGGCNSFFNSVDNFGYAVGDVNYFYTKHVFRNYYYNNRLFDVEDCAAMCNNQSKCVSFEYSKKQSHPDQGFECRLSSECYNPNSDDNLEPYPFYLYVRD